MSAEPMRMAVPVHEGERPAVGSVTVVLPTIGRPELIKNCLESLARCVPRADEILVVDSSDDDAVENVVAGFAAAGARRIRSTTPGLGSAFNLVPVTLNKKRLAVQRLLERNRSTARVLLDAR